MSSANDIWNDMPHGLPEERLTAYLEGRLSPEEAHEVEAWLATEGMESDAIEGLQDIAPDDATQRVQHLNRDLRRQLGSKRRRQRKYFKENKWGVVAIAVIILLIVLGFAVLKMSLKGH